DAKPSPMPVIPEKNPEKTAERRESAAVSRGEPLSPPRISVISSPGGATATLDGRAECKTPCSLDASPGRHVVSVVLPGYEVERREITLSSEREVELPIVVMRASGGTVMLTSVPPGAAVFVDGRSTGKVTPAQLPLPSGPHLIRVEKDGRQAT